MRSGVDEGMTFEIFDHASVGGYGSCDICEDPANTHIYEADVSLFTCKECAYVVIKI